MFSKLSISVFHYKIKNKRIKTLGTMTNFIEIEVVYINYNYIVVVCHFILCHCFLYGIVTKKQLTDKVV